MNPDPADNNFKMGIVKTEEGGAEDEGVAREEAAIEEEARNSEAEDLDVEGVEVKEDGLTPDITVDLAKSVEDICVRIVSCEPLPS